QGRWPEFAVEVTAYAKKHHLSIPPLGDCRKDRMPPEVIQTVEKWEKELKKSDAGRADLKALDEAQGKWPDYPRLIVEVARKHRQPVPGWPVPAPPQHPHVSSRPPA